VIRTIVADDQALVRSGFRMILDAQDDIEVVAETSDGRETVDVARRLKPDVVLMDVRMPRLDGIEATRQLLSRADQSTKVLILTTFDLDEYVYEAMRAGACGFLLKDVPPRQLIAAVRDVASGEAIVAPAITRRLIEQFVRRRPPGNARPAQLATLTEREVEVLVQLARGLSNAEIGQELLVSANTARTHVGRILMKLNLRDRVQAVVLAYEAGLVAPGDHTGA
jgi:DNA-binding NarL/FixJ family response regulator